MEGMEEKLGAILGNPQMMQQIMSMANSLSGQEAESPPPTESPFPDFDPEMLQKMLGLAGQMGVDRQQQALLCALEPYLTRNRLKKLEKAMRAAKMARLASGFLGSGGLQMLSGR